MHGSAGEVARIGSMGVEQRVLSMPPRTQSPYPRENFYGDLADEEPNTETTTGHVETDGTEPASHLAFRHISALVSPVCYRTLRTEPWNGGRTAELCAWLFDDECIDGRGEQLHREQRAVELSEPEFYLPKQRETEHGYEEYRQHNSRRRINPETGYINWGESTKTGLPEIDYETYRRAAANYLATRGISCLNVEDYENLVDCFWHDPQYNSHQSLEQFIRVIREREGGH
jgi:hypothetical protein